MRSSSNRADARSRAERRQRSSAQGFPCGSTKLEVSAVTCRLLHDTPMYLVLVPIFGSRFTRTLVRNARPLNKLLSCSRRAAHPRMHLEDEGPMDPDNMPPRSRLFLVVPKAADAAAIEVSRLPLAILCSCSVRQSDSHMHPDICRPI